MIRALSLPFLLTALLHPTLAQQPGPGVGGGSVNHQTGLEGPPGCPKAVELTATGGHLGWEVYGQQLGQLTFLPDWFPTLQDPTLKYLSWDAKVGTRQLDNLGVARFRGHITGVDRPSSSWGNLGVMWAHIDIGGQWPHDRHAGFFPEGAEGEFTFNAVPGYQVWGRFRWWLEGQATWVGAGETEAWAELSLGGVVIKSANSQQGPVNWFEGPAAVYQLPQTAKLAMDLRSRTRFVWGPGAGDARITARVEFIPTLIKENGNPAPI